MLEHLSHHSDQTKAYSKFKSISANIQFDRVTQMNTYFQTVKNMVPTFNSG